MIIVEQEEEAKKALLPAAAMEVGEMGSNLGKRKRGIVLEKDVPSERILNCNSSAGGNKIVEMVVVADNDDDPLFATERTRQRLAKKPKKVNGISKEIVTKDFTAELADYEAALAKDPEGAARRYQLEVLAEAQRRNTIVYLETGCGKTLIAVLLIKSLAHKLRIRDKKKVALFLAPTVNLVKQQAGVISLHTDLKVRDYYGSLGVDTWKPERWQEEVNKYEVLVMTPMILVDLLSHAIIKFDVVELLIFDECHHAHKKHGYCKIMDRYKDVPENARPKVFGMTASPVIRKGVKSEEDCQFQLARLEQNLDAKVCTVKDRSELESFVPTPRTQGVEYDSPFMAFEEYKVKLQAIAEKCQKFEHAMPEDNEQFKDYVELSKKLEKSINRYQNALVYCLQELGLWCAYKASVVLLKHDIKDMFSEPDMDVVAVLKVAKDKFLKEAVELFSSPLREVSCSREEDMAAAVKAGLLTPKVGKLVEVLLKYRDSKDMRCIVFVERVAGAIALSSLINDVKLLSFLRCEYLAGVSGALDPASRAYQDQVLLKFRNGKVNLLIATNVAEEGLDIQACHSVIRFDGCRTVRSYIQSRGRARRPGSDYIVFMEKGNEKQKEELDGLVESELTMVESAQDRTSGQAAPSLPPEVEHIEIYRVESTGASLTTLSAVAFIYRYCSRLPGDKYYTPRPEFHFSVGEGKQQHICTLILPPNAAVREVVGPKQSSQVLAKQVACLEACKLLHSLGAISDYLLPVPDDGDNDDDEDKINLKALKKRGTGTTKQKELHGTKNSTKLRGSWGKAETGQIFHAYSLSFSPDERDTNVYASFSLLVEAKLDDDVANLEVELAMKGGMMGRAKFFPAGEVSLSPEEIKDCKDSQEIFLNAMFSKLLNRTGRSQTNGGTPTLTSHKTLVLANEEDRSRVWDENKMYLLLPNLPKIDTVEQLVTPAIDWEDIRKTAHAGRMFRSVYVPPPAQGIDDFEGQSSSASSELASEDHLRMALGTSSEVSGVVNCVVLTVHTGMIYLITKVLHDKTAESAFPVNDGEVQKFRTYNDYFRQMHKQVLKYPQQAMLQARSTYNPRNLLARNSISGSGKSKKKKKAGASEQESERCYVELPPELCIILGVSESVLRTTYLLPSVMHRLDAALAASQLRDSIAVEFPQPVIPVMRIVESLTTLRCLEGFSLEGLELLGDSFLKYAWSKSLFLTYTDKHEGQLSGRRSREICNAKLHELAFQRDLPEYIRDEVFDPSRWVAPGKQPPKSLLCRCNLANLYRNQREEEEKEKEKEKEKKEEEEGAEKPKKKQKKKVFKIGKSCGNGHRWICSKTISDVVEALIGAYVVESDDDGALNFMTWVGMEGVKVDPLLIEKARDYMVCDPTVNVGADLEALEARLNYTFKNKSLLIEAITHASHHDLSGGFCYQRLEYLGDAALDYLITKHLYFSYPGLTPGRLTDLRSAAVNNDCFARIAVKHGLNKYLRHGSGFLLKQIEEYIRSTRESGETEKETSHGWDGVKGPKVLGDLVESIAGAVLVDSGFDLESVWVVMKPLLSPIVTPESLTLHPVRRLQEMCQTLDYKVLFRLQAVDQLTQFTIEVNVGDELLCVTSREAQKKNAQKTAAEKMLAQLKDKHSGVSQNICKKEAAAVVEENVGSTEVGGLEKQIGASPDCKRKFGVLYVGEENEHKKATKHPFSVNMSCVSVHLSADEHRKEMETESQAVVVRA